MARLGGNTGGALTRPFGLPLRAQLEAEIDRLIALLDLIDGDADLEGDAADCEPSLGWVTRDCGRIVTGSDSDLELVA